VKRHVDILNYFHPTFALSLSLWLKNSQSDIRRGDAPSHTGITDETVQKDEATGNRELSIRESTGEKGRSLGSGAHRSEDVRMPMAETGAGWSV